MNRLSKGKRVSGELRNEVQQSFVERYEAGESIRSLAAECGRSYGFVQGLLKDAGVTFRQRGGPEVRRRIRMANRRPLPWQPVDGAVGEFGSLELVLPNSLSSIGFIAADCHRHCGG